MNSTTMNSLLAKLPDPISLTTQSFGPFSFLQCKWCNILRSCLAVSYFGTKNLIATFVDTSPCFHCPPSHSSALSFQLSSASFYLLECHSDINGFTYSLDSKSVQSQQRKERKETPRAPSQTRWQSRKRTATSTRNSRRITDTVCAWRCHPSFHWRN